MKALSLFSNVGVAETYLQECGVDVVVANELLEQREYISYYQDKFPSDAINNINNDYRYYKKLRSILVNMILDDEFLDKFDMLCQDNDDAQTPDVIKMYKKRSHLWR